MNITYKKFIFALGICLLPTVSQASVINFDFTGRLIVADTNGEIIVNNGSTFTDISASMSYDTITGLGGNGDSNSLSITMNGADFLSQPPTFHDVSMTRQTGTNLIDGIILVDWNGSVDMQLHIEWDATGLFNAIDLGLQAGDVLSGTNLYYDTNGNGVYDAGIDTYRADIGSATPFSDTLTSTYLTHTSGGAAPMASTANSLGLITGPFQNSIAGYFDIGTGNSIHITSVSQVPVPAAVWLFGSGLLGLIGVARRKAA